MLKPFFSVIIPTYNQASFLKKAIESTLNQTYKNFEIIVIDNNSKDGTASILKEYKKKIICKKINNKGVIAKSRNLGIKLAKGKWVAFLDSDDYWSKHKLHTIKKYIRNPLFDVICHSEWILYEKKKNFKLWSYGPYEKNFYEKLLKYGNKLCTSATVVKKNFLLRNKLLFDEKKSFITCEDYSLVMNMARKKANFHFVKEPLGYHFFHENNLSANAVNHLKVQETTVKHHIFNVQDFTKNKEKLWQDAKVFLDLKKIFFNLKKESKLKQFKDISVFFMQKPLYTICYIQNLLLKKLKDYLTYLFYRSEF